MYKINPKCNGIPFYKAPVFYFTLKNEDPMGSPSGTSATDGRLRKVGSLSLRSSRLTNTVVLADARSGGVPPKEGAKGIDKDIFICTHTHTHTISHGQRSLLATVKSFMVNIKL